MDKLTDYSKTEYSGWFSIILNLVSATQTLMRSHFFSQFEVNIEDVSMSVESGGRSVSC